MMPRIAPRGGDRNVMPLPPSPADRASLRAYQERRLKGLVDELLAKNPFWQERLRRHGLGAGLDSLEDFSRHLPPIEKAELVRDQQRHPPYGSALTYPLQRYVRMHQTSGTTGEPMRWLDTAESWQALLDVWRRVFLVAGMGPEDRIFFPFSFGPFLGFWTAFDAASQVGCLALPGGGLTSQGRVELLLANGATAICCTPTYAIRLAEVAAQMDVDLTTAGVRVLFVAGEPGGSMPTVRQRISALWGGAQVCDQHGMTEVGPVSYGNPRWPDLLHIVETSYFAEVVDGQSLEPVAPGEEGELLLTTLDRWGSPLLRYRTGDLVRVSQRPPEELGFVDMALEGGILARLDDMVVVRGVNLYPSAVDEVVRRLGGVAEYRVTLHASGALTEITVEVEAKQDVEVKASQGAAPDDLPGRLEAAFRGAFQMRIPVRLVAAGTLPRYELKAKRWRRVV